MKYGAFKDYRLFVLNCALHLCYLSGVGFGLGWFEEGVWKLPQPHWHRWGHGGAFGVHHGVKERLQISLRVSSDMDHLVSCGGVMLARVHHFKSRSKDPKKVFKKSVMTYLIEALKDASTARRNSEMHESDRV